MLAHWIWFAERKLTDHWKDVLLKHFSDPEDIYCAEREDLFSVPDITAEVMQELENKDLQPARKIMAVCQQEDIRILTMQDVQYPQKLRSIGQPPLVLYYRGEFPEFDKIPAVGVVGTRKASVYGLSMARRFGAELAACGMCVVSGGALGIDTKAMEGAFAAEGAPVCILGCGVDVVYPRSNRELFAKVAAKGCVISEYPPGTPAHSWNFPRRNRIISALSDAVLVVEAPEKSGAMITARHAIEQGRDLFAIPTNLNAATGAGSNRLLRDGAALVTEGWDIACLYEGKYPEHIRHWEGTVPAEEAPSVILEKVAQIPAVPADLSSRKTIEDKKDVDNGENSSYSVSRCNAADLTETEQQILALVTPEPISADEIIDKTGLPSGTVLSALTTLSMKGAVRNHPGRCFSLK